MTAVALDPVGRAIAWQLDGVAFAVDAGLPEPDETQRQVLRDDRPAICITASRQWGKSSLVSAVATRTALLEPDSLVLIGSTGERIAGLMIRKCRDRINALAQRELAPRIAREAEMQLEFGNGSRLIALPGAEARVRGYSAPKLIIIDESARVPDALFHALIPMLAQSPDGRMILLSSAYAEQGFHWAIATGSDPSWARYTIPATQCPRFTGELLAAHRAALGSRVFAREYLCVWGGSTDQLFPRELLIRALDSTVQPLFPVRPAA